jgi:hypothetical protein
VRERIACNKNVSYYFCHRSWKCSLFRAIPSFKVESLNIAMEEGEIVQMNLQKSEGKVWNGFVWLMIRISGGVPQKYVYVWLPWLRFFHAFFSVVKQMPGQNPRRRGKARTLPSCCVALCIFCVVLCIFVFFVLFVVWRFLYFLCVYVYWTTATGWLPNCS